ncbi:MAG TPA: redoxin family protein [Acetobacteraceae bacterium]|nr:redoxin family protein [Acetobacteraceae bacterium]
MTALLPRRAVLLAPAGIAVLGGVALLALRERWRAPVWQMLGESNALLGRKLPAFVLPGLATGPGFASADVAAAGRPVLINFFASWCVPCRLEMPVLRSLEQSGLPIWGIAYRDHPDDAAGFLRRFDDPYQRVGSDESGAAGRAFGLYGVPGSFLVDRGGVVRWSWAGALSGDVVRQDLDPLLHL